MMHPALQVRSLRQTDGEQRTAISTVRHGKGAAMLCDHSVSERQTDAVALRFSREERNKDSLQISFRNAMARVGESKWLPTAGRVRSELKMTLTRRTALFSSIASAALRRRFKSAWRNIRASPWISILCALAAFSASLR